MPVINKSHSKGFTLIEVIVVIPALLVIIATLLGVLILILRQNNTARTTLNVTYSTQQALDILDNDVRYSSRFLIAPDPSPLTDTYGSNNSGQAWSYKDYDAQHRVLIVRSYSSTDNLLSETRRSVYKDQVGCSGIAMYANPVLQYNIVYFVKNNTLYKRTLVDTTTSTCNTQYQKQSCPTDVAYPRNAICGADDEILLQNVDSMEVQYYVAPSDSTPIDAFNSTETDILNEAQSALITLSSSVTVGAEPITSTLSLRVNKLNL